MTEPTSNLPDNQEKWIAHARGFLELEMFNDALESLGKIDPTFQNHPRVLNMKLKILTGSGQWDEGSSLGQWICKIHPEDEIAFILTSQCFYELGEVKIARETLMSGPESLKETALYHYNMACYSAELGVRDDAERAIRTCLEMDKALLKTALEDPSLESIKSFLKSF